MNYPEVEQVLGYTFKDKNLLKRALTLPSADPEENNQTMEFFGDAILEFLVSERIYDEGKSEGELTELRKQLVSDSALTPVSEKLGLDKLLIRSSGDTTNKKAIPSAYEAVLAAIYLDGGMDSSRDFVNRTMSFTAVKPQINYKGRLQEYLQDKKLALPEYSHEDVGTPQKPKFRSVIAVGGHIYEGVADNVKQADQLAARAALSALGA